MTDDELVARARAGDAEARRALVDRTSLRTARVILGDSAQDRYEALRELARGDGPAPALGPLLAAIAAAGDGTADGEVRRGAELVYRARPDRWGPPERAAAGRFAARLGARLGADHALELLEWAARFPGDVDDFVRGAAAGLADLPVDGWEQVGWRAGFEELVLRDRERVPRWAGAQPSARAVAQALLTAHARGRGSCVPALEAIWDHVAGDPARRDAWAAALAHATSQHGGMTGRAEVAAAGWRRFCAREAERRALYTAFAPWRHEWMELRNATPLEQRPGGASAVAHLQLWAGLELEQLTQTVDEAVRLARDADWPALVDATFELAEAAPPAQRLYALAGACAIGHEVCNRAREADAPGPWLEAAADRFLARAEGLASRLRTSGAVLDRIVANRAEDLETDARLIREARARRDERAAAAAERAAAAAEREERVRQQAAAAEQARLAAEAQQRAAAEARQQAEAARLAAAAELQRHLAAAAGAAGRPPEPRLMPAIELTPIDREPFFASLPAPTLLDYARVLKRLTSGDPGAMQALAAEGVSMEMVAVINQTWTALFAARTDLAIRFSALLAARWA